MALAQCARFLADHPELKQIIGDDTAGSVAEVMKLNCQHRAAIASKRAAQIYGGVVIQQNIQDDEDNFTRFVLLKKPN